MERDNQRNKVFKACWDFEGAHPELKFSDIKEVQIFLDKVVRHSWIKKLAPNLGRVTVYSNRISYGVANRSKAYYDLAPATRGRHYGYSIELAPKRLDRIVVLHELAHTLTYEIYDTNFIAAHGREFAKLHKQLVRRYMGKAAEKELVRYYKAYGVKYCCSQITK